MDSFVEPNLETLANYNGEWEKFIEAIYSIFKEDFLVKQPKRGAITIDVRPTIDHQNKEKVFWHITSEGNVEADRTPDLRRCERIRYPRPMIELEQATNLYVWERDLQTSRGREKRLHISLEDFSYIIVLSPIEHKTKRWLITTYYVEHNHQRQKRKKHYEEYIKEIQSK